MQRLRNDYYREPKTWTCTEGKKGSGYWIINCANGTLGHLRLDGDGNGEENARLVAASPGMRDAIINTLRALELDQAGVSVNWDHIKTMLEDAIN
jgi:hypothetical protein